MELAETVRRRRMVRRYLPDPVDPAALARIVDAARRAPSAGFAQGQSMVVVTDADLRRQVAERCGEERHAAAGRPRWLSTAPAHLVLLTRPEAYRERYACTDKADPGAPDRWRAPFWWVDAGCALQLVLLAAVDEGLGAGVLGLDHADGLAGLLGLPDDVEPVVLVTVGHPHPDDAPVGSAARRERLPMHEFAHWQRHGRPLPAGWGAGADRAPDRDGGPRAQG